jgi:hypothetical protein
MSEGQVRSRGQSKHRAHPRFNGGVRIVPFAFNSAGVVKTGEPPQYVRRRAALHTASRGIDKHLIELAEQAEVGE